MRLFLRIVLVGMIVTGGALMANHDGSCDSQEFEKYFSKDSEINITMDYIQDWDYEESRGSYSSYAQVQFYGELVGNIAPSIAVNIKHASKVDFEPLTIEAMADDIIGKRMLLSEAKVLSKSETEFLGLPAIDMTLTYQEPDMLRNLDAQLILFKERLIIFKKNDRFYTLTYSNPEEQFEVFEDAFLHCINTLSFKE